jgi:Zn-dependent protease
MSSDDPAYDYLPPRRRRRWLPALLFAATCLSTFWAGATSWNPAGYLDAIFRVTAANWPQGSPLAAVEEAYAVAERNLHVHWLQGLLYMGLVLTILVAHEMGHFLTARRYRIPASLPYFIPVPVIPFGTLGAVIGMEGSRANRREMFDLGIAGPLAGLVLTLPVLGYGILLLPATSQPDSLGFYCPLLLEHMIAWLRPDYPSPDILYFHQFNPYLMAGWVGMLVTGLNMLPVSQLDGGHVSYALLGRRAHLLARSLLVAAILGILATEHYFWVPMLVLVILIGTDHPPTADDRCRLGFLRRLLGWASLLIPVLCFPLRGIVN